LPAKPAPPIYLQRPNNSPNSRRIAPALQWQTLIPVGVCSSRLPNFGGGSPFVLPAALATAFLEGAGIPAPCRARLDDRRVLFHGLGSAGGALLAGAFAQVGAAVRRTGRFAHVLGPTDRWPPPRTAEQALDRRHRSLAQGLAMGAYHGDLPLVEQREAVAALSEIDRVGALLDRGPPPEADVADADLWEEAAWA